MKKYDDIIDKVIALYPDKSCELEYGSPYQLLIAVILSAQCTDKRVNAVTKELFKLVKTPQDLVSLGEENLKRYIFSCGFYNNKAKNIVKMSKDLILRFDSKVPNNFDDLVSLDGVGEKTASVVLATAFNLPAFAVDTHVFRLSKRLGLADEVDAHKTMVTLKNRISEDRWSKGHFALVLHGRYCCYARKPDCENCQLKEDCKFYKTHKG